MKTKNNIHKELFYMTKSITREAESMGHDYVSIPMNHHDRAQLSYRNFKKFKKYWAKKGWVYQEHVGFSDRVFEEIVLRKVIQKRSYGFGSVQMKDIIKEINNRITICYCCEKPKKKSEYKLYEPEHCCNGRFCGCMGRPINPPICDECMNKGKEIRL